MTTRRGSIDLAKVPRIGLPVIAHKPLLADAPERRMLPDRHMPARYVIDLYTMIAAT
ncbi:hypothetical protein QLH51_06095 [Sphingomonas sp. 2R-10]|uniref:hypothetical protein n=1 Tax=Sphingomonas sp. 2R-10 TaxID=3045148 RepID=UPI0013DDE03E|nr:hypothetical protein [Sphingomonas sp. 2R-10]MDJ0276368.1 hypothetical protein [Sphingomonas sp. 2R-10]